MRKNIDISEITLTKLKILSAFKNTNIKSLTEKSITYFIEQKERFEKLTDRKKI